MELGGASFSAGIAGWIQRLVFQGRYGRGQDIQMYNKNMIWRYIWSVAERGLHLNISDFVSIRIGKGLEECSLLVPAFALEQTHLETQLCLNIR